MRPNTLLRRLLGSGPGDESRDADDSSGSETGEMDEAGANEGETAVEHEGSSGDRERRSGSGRSEGYLEAARGGYRRAVEMLLPDIVARRYALKFNLSFLIVILVIASVGGYGYVQAQDSVEQSTDGQLQSAAGMQADSLSEWVTSISSQTRVMADDPALRADDVNESDAYLRGTYRHRSTDLRYLHYVNPETGTVEASTTSDMEGLTFDDIDEPWTEDEVFEETIADDAVWISPTAYESELEDDVIAVVTPVPGDDGYLVGIATIEGRVAQLYQSGPNQATIILNSQGETVFEAEEATDLDDERRAQLVDADDEDPVVVGDENIYGSAEVRGTDWVAVSIVSQEEAYEVRDIVGSNVLMIVLAGIISLGLVGAALGRGTIRPLVALREKTERMEQGDLQVDLSTERRDEIGQLYHGFASMRDSLEEQIDAVQTARQEAERERERAEAMNRHLVQKADEYSEVMRTCADGDLTGRMDPESENDAMVEIAREFNEMIEEIEHAVASLKSFGDEVAAASEEVTASAEEVRASSGQVTESIQTISGGADRQNEQLTDVQTEAEQLSATTEEIASLSNEVAAIAERTAETGEEARTAAEAALDEMDTVDGKAGDTVAAMEQLQTQIEQIEEITEFISDVAEQTNILALNANIEAARAGEAGEGFAVVAEEVKSLAEDTREAAAEIEGLVGEVQEQAYHTAEEVHATSEEVARSTDAVETAVDALEEIAGYAEETNVGVQEISAATQQQSSSTERVVSMVDDVASISEETNSQAGNVAAAAEEQTNALNEVSRSMDNMSTRAIQLTEMLSRFETEAEGDEFEAVDFEDEFEVALPEPDFEGGFGDTPFRSGVEDEDEPEDDTLESSSRAGGEDDATR